MNPMDWRLQHIGNLACTWLKSPCIYGSDLAGEVAEIGSGEAASHFKDGDRILTLAVGIDLDYKSQAQSVFQKYTIVEAYTTFVLWLNIFYSPNAETVRFQC
jgi:NADPH:quinone reductase-like Zn-dependent oxidoreductase